MEGSETKTITDSIKTPNKEPNISHLQEKQSESITSAETKQKPGETDKVGIEKVKIASPEKVPLGTEASRKDTKPGNDDVSSRSFLPKDHSPPPTPSTSQFNKTASSQHYNDTSVLQASESVNQSALNGSDVSSAFSQHNKRPNSQISPQTGAVNDDLNEEDHAPDISSISFTHSPPRHAQQTHEHSFQTSPPRHHTSPNNGFTINGFHSTNGSMLGDQDNLLDDSPRSVRSNTSKRSFTSRKSAQNSIASEPNTYKLFHTIDLLGVEYKCVITTCNQNNSELLYWIINVFAPPRTDLGEDTNTLCYELIIRSKQAKQITHGQMTIRALRDLVIEALFRPNDQDNSYFRYFFMKPPGVDIEDGDRIAEKARGNRLRAPSGPNDTLVLKISQRSSVGDIAFWLPLKPVFGVFSKFSQEQLEEKILMMEKRFQRYDDENASLRHQLLTLRADNTKLQNQLKNEADEKLQILQRISTLGEEARSNASAMQNVHSLVRQQQHRMQEVQQQLQSTQNHAQRENQELKDLILKETEKAMRMKLSIAAQNESYAKLMHQVKKGQDGIDSRLAKIEQAGTEEVVENVQLNVRELQEQFKNMNPGGGALSEDAQRKIDQLTENYEKIERELERLKSTRPSDAVVNADIKKLKQQNDILRKNHLRCLQENASIKLENMELKQMIKTLQDDNKDLQKDLEELLQRDSGLPPPSALVAEDYSTPDIPGMSDSGSNFQNDTPFSARSVTSALEWSGNYLGIDLSLSNGNRTVRRSGQSEETWQTAISSRTYIQQGLYEWTVKLTDACADADIFIGVIDPAECDVNRGDIGESERGWALYCASGEIYHAGNSKDYGRELFTGSTITARLNLEDNTLSFSIDGVDMGVAFNNVTGPVAPAVSFNFEDNYQVTLE
mmetsp:Transcript_5668/g.21370  ORF Transcript_5668/g.21370 Transcript_5668/m.21370 type:complete len:899 (-) Transcript_5668:1182-3878(-)|eukprot:CAMPEP_0117446950 /NCGR_PEP_ID=MMETSP0759-20121206/6616_1 /TAXON_ID=63605 /ORGANISM="Percolomonas cosmopolitus, Strain WS" /LENGTH=898 /DNA_ID=CAMNT_0005239255 /DNA_START=224 /DNA_END=2923 /DNA_ORIENTATION=+